MPPLISATLLVRNERENLPLALRSLEGWVDEVVVVDGESTDGTADVARAFGAKVFVRPPRGAMEEDGAFAIAQCKGQWVFHLDADEVVPRPLGRKLREAAQAGAADAFEVHEMSHFLGAPCNVWRGRKLRLFRRGAVDVTDRIHRMHQLRPGTRLGVMPGGPGMELQHYWIEGIAPLLRRLDRYTGVEAEQNPPLPRAAKPRVFLRFARAFLGAYLRDGGIRHGWRGAYLSLHRGFYAATVEARRAERTLGGAAAIRAQYRREAAALLEQESLPAAMAAA
ncbi:MAG: glycosyltransferase [Halobacteriales archaeon]|nr:glycosyltransferase [Halobacteriales archaeon]